MNNEREIQAREGLQKRFAELTSQSDPYGFFLHSVLYLQYVSETPSLSGMAEGILRGERSAALRDVYRSLDTWQGVGQDIENAKSSTFLAGYHMAHEVPMLFKSGLARSKMRIFHDEILSGLADMGIEDRIEVVINKGQSRIYLANNLEHGHTFSARGKYKREGGSQRFQIILTLLQARTGISAATLAKKLNVEDVGSVRRAVDEINKVFKSKIHPLGEVIRIEKMGAQEKEIYSLNRERYVFSTKRGT